jgi:hypothetical protein
VRRGWPDIGCRWGSLVGGPVRLGGRHYRLVVYPPGTDERERRLLQTWRWWPGGGALLATTTLGVLSDPVGLPIALVLAVTLFLGPFLALRRILRRPRRDMAVVHAEYLYGPSAAADLARCRRLVSLGSTLIDAEQALDRGELTPVGFQLVWGDVHSQALAPETRDSARSTRTG